MTDVGELVPVDLHEFFVWLGKLPAGWMTMSSPEHPDGVPRTQVDVKWSVFDTAPGRERFGPEIRRFRREASRATLIVPTWESFGRMLADGPKLFVPTDEQWESMEHVEINLPPRDFRSPFPSLVVRIPQQCRGPLADRSGYPRDRAPGCVLVRTHDDPRFLVVTVPFKPEEEHFLFSDCPGNPTIEVAINRRVKNGVTIDPGRQTPAEQSQQRFGLVACRAALNLCVMLAHFGCRVAGPVDPAAYRRHRAKKALARYKHGDCLAVEMTQHVVVRSKIVTTAGNPPGPGTGAELAPHWRKGHWRAYPGCGARRAAGEKVPLLFVRPALVRPDRIVGDLSGSAATYRGV